MIDLRRAIQGYLGSIDSDVCFQRATDAAEFPYLTYSFESLPDGEGHELIILDVDGWDSPTDGDTTRLENLMVEVSQHMNKKTLTADNFVVSFYLDKKLTLEDDDPRIIRRRHIYQGRLFERGE